MPVGGLGLKGRIRILAEIPFLYPAVRRDAGREKPRKSSLRLFDVGRAFSENQRSLNIITESLSDDGGEEFGASCNLAAVAENVLGRGCRTEYEVISVVNERVKTELSDALEQGIYLFKICTVASVQIFIEKLVHQPPHGEGEEGPTGKTRGRQSVTEYISVMTGGDAAGAEHIPSKLPALFRNKLYKIK